MPARSPFMPAPTGMEALLARSLGRDGGLQQNGLPGLSAMAGHGQVRGPSSDPDEMQLHLHVPEQYAGAILGKGGQLMKQTEAHAGCRVSMTSRDSGTDRRVVIIGNSQQGAIAQSLIHEQL